MTTNYYAKNLEHLRLRNPGLADAMGNPAPDSDLVPEPARNGRMTVKIDGIFLHSPYDPRREARDWAEGNYKPESRAAGDAGGQTVLGFGLGYHLQALVEMGARGTVIEPDPRIIRLAMENSDLTGVIDSFDIISGVSPERLHRSFGGILSGAILPHHASLRLQPKYLGGLRGYAEALRYVKKGGLKILVVNPIYGGSLPAARHCASALRRMGHMVFTYNSEMFAEGMKLSETYEYSRCKQNFLGELTAFLSRGVELKVKEIRPDMILALAQAPLTPETLGNIDTMGIPTAFWFVEDYKVLPYWRDTARYYSYFFGIQDSEFEELLNGVGVSRYSYLPTAAAADVHLPVQLNEDEIKEYGSPLSFVGAGYFNRQIFFKGLTDYPFRIWGSDWPLALPLAPFIQRNASRIDTATCVKIFNASQVNLNLHSSTHREGVAEDGDFVNPRTFEIACCGAFQLVDRRRLLPDLFDQEEMETFSDLGELRGKIDHYLADDEGRRSFAEKGRRRVLREHTYERRMEELLSIMVSSFPHLAERHRERLERRSSILAELHEHEGLDELMSRMPRGEWFSLEDIYRSIGPGNETLSRAEKIFSLLRHVETIREAPPQ